MIRDNLILFLSIVFLLIGNGYADPIVNTPLGVVKGSFMQSRKNTTFSAFRGMRYAQPPVGELRFQPPVPVSSWEEEFDATEDAAACSQPGGGDITPKSEDCLFINVYTRQVNSSDLKPVLVFLHAGGFYSITGQSIWYGPDYLMDQDIVLVTLNYRLATLGFLSTGDKAAVGNYGMKDQVQALRWVRDNIAAFGGDPKKVTLGGYSAGAASVMLHMISPMSRGLFSQAIAMSGSAAHWWALNKDPLRLAKKQAQLLGCPTEPTSAIVSCIKEIPAQNTARIYSGLWEWGYDPLVVLSPVVEPDLGDGSERFLTQDPVKSLQEGDFAAVPLIIGTTKDEFAQRALFIVENETWANDMSENWDQVAPIPFMYEPNHNISTELRRQYLGDISTPITNDSLAALGRLYADSVIIFGSQRAAKLVAAKNPPSAPVYLYQFTYAGQYSHATWPGTQTPFGVVHHDDLLYLFYIGAFPRFNNTGDDAASVDRSTTLWSNFIKSGNPTPADNLLNVTWEPFTNEKPTYLEIGSSLNNHIGLYYEDRIKVWENLFPLKY